MVTVENKGYIISGKVWHGGRLEVDQAVRLLVDLLVDSLGSLGFLLGDEATDPRQRLVADDKSSEQGSLSMGNDTLLLSLLDLGVVDLEDVVAALEAHAVGQEDEALGVGVNVGGGLLDSGEALVKASQGGVAEGVGLGDVRRDVLVRLGEKGDDGGSESLVGGISQGNGALAVLVRLEGLDAIVDDGVVEEVLYRHQMLASRRFFPVSDQQWVRS